MTPTKAKMDETLRNYALDNLRSAVRRLKDGDDAVVAPSGGRDWRAVHLDRAVKWATVAEALRPDIIEVHPTFNFTGGEDVPPWHGE